MYPFLCCQDEEEDDEEEDEDEEVREPRHSPTFWFIIEFNLSYFLSV